MTTPLLIVCSSLLSHFLSPLRIVTLSLRSPILLSYSDISLPEFETFSDHTEETSSGSTTTHIDNSLPGYDSFLFKIDPDQGELTSVVIEDILGEPHVYVPITRNKIFNLGIFFEVQSKRFLSRDTFFPTYVSLPFEDRHYLSFTYVIQTFLPYFTYPVKSPFLLSFESEDIIFDADISVFHFSSLEPVDPTNFDPKGEDLQIINEELAEYINSPSWNHPAFYDDDDYEYSIQVSEFLEKSPIAVAPILPTKEPDSSLSMGDEHLSTIPKTKSDKVIKSSVEDLVPIPKFAGELVQIDPILPGIDETNSDPKDDIRFIEQLLYDDTSKEVQDDILHAKLLNIHLLIAKIESLNNNPTLDYVLKSPSLSSLSYSDNSLPEFETFNDHAEETSSGSTTTRADNSLLEYDSFLFEIELDQGELSKVFMKAILGEPCIYVPNVLPTHSTLYQDSDFFSSDDYLRSDLEISFPSETRKKIFDLGIFLAVQSKRFLSWDTFL
nr:hypothetical protein [Tanacetum cinerariifolium]